MDKPLFSYPRWDEDPYLSWFKNDFSSVFVATIPFLKIPDFPLNATGGWVPNQVLKVAKQRGMKVGVTWQEIADLCGFPSIAHVNRALRMTGSKRIADAQASPADTAIMLKKCSDQNIFTPDEGYFSPLSELSLASFLKELGHDEVTVADHFGISPRQMVSKAFLLPEVFSTPEIHSIDKSVYISIHTDYHFFLVCQTKRGRATANPSDHFEGFFADQNTSDLWGVGKLSGGANGS